MAGNQLGKTWSGGFELAMHLTGRYPDWWQGRTWDRATRWWAGSVTGELAREGLQTVLLGRPGNFGTGAIPADAIDDVTSRRGLADAVDSIRIRHAGGISSVTLKSYDQGREKWQAGTVDGVWFDEEPPPEIYSEGLTRTNATGGLVFTTFTPLLGMSEVVRLFHPAPTTPDRHVTRMTIDDVEHISAEDKARIVASYAPHEREARTSGEPMLGSGRVFPISEADIAEDAVPIPPHWRQIVGLDFGWDHPTAAAWIAYDADNDTVHVIDAYRRREETPVVHAAAIKARGAWIPVAWPHDGLQHDKGSGEQLAEQYRRQGLKMLPERATFADGTNGVEAGLFEMFDRMRTGRLKIARHLGDWWAEFRTYHRDEGRVVKEADDLMSATRYAIMMLRFARTEPEPERAPRYGLKRPSPTGWMSA